MGTHPHVVLVATRGQVRVQPLLEGRQPVFAKDSWLVSVRPRYYFECRMSDLELPLGAPVKYTAVDDPNETFRDALEIYVEERVDDDMMTFSCRMADGNWMRGQLGRIRHFTVIPL
jgi:hypothetical protein